MAAGDRISPAPSAVTSTVDHPLGSPSLAREGLQEGLHSLQTHPTPSTVAFRLQAQRLRSWIHKDLVGGERIDAKVGAHLVKLGTEHTQDSA